MTTNKSKKVCVLGAGAAGLCAARHSVDAGHHVTVFEQLTDVGGTWLYSPEINVFSSLYEDMVSNLPKEIMVYEHLKFETGKRESFVRHEEVLAYLKRYAEPVRELIRFNTRVTKVKRVDSKWQVTVEPIHATDNHTSQPETFDFDVLFVCNGHYSQPRIPEFAKKLKIPWTHSHNYRRPHEYKDKEVVIVGGNPSGFDIATHLSKYAKKIHMLHNQRFTYSLPPNIVYNHKLKDVENDGRTLLLENDEKIETANALIFCNGYCYELPFLEKGLIELKADANYISPLYQHFVHCEYPNSLFLIGLPYFVIPFICFDLQVHYALALVDGTAPIPSKQELYQCEANRLKTLEERNLPLRYVYRMAENDHWNYFEELAKLGNRPNVPLVIRRIYEENIKNMGARTAEYKNLVYRIKNEEEYECEEL